jgi:hypothetical protein
MNARSGPSDEIVSGPENFQLGVSGPLLRMADMSPFWFCIYLNGVWKSGGENRTVCEVHTTLLLTLWKGAP